MTQPFPQPGQEPSSWPAPSPSSWPRRRTILLAAVAVAAAGAGAAGVLAITGHGSPGTPPGVSSYLCYNGPASGNATLLQWKTSSNGVLSGTFQDASVTGTAPNEQVSTSSGPLSGQVNGSGVSVDIGIGSEVFGKIAGSKLTLEVPQQDGTIQPVTCAENGAGL